jgi:protein gp37
MASTNTGISWTSTTWNPVHGCDITSDGCTNCYALTMAKRLKAMGQPGYQNDGRAATSGPGFAVTLAPAALSQPLRWKNPRRIFVDSMGDLFHSAVPDTYIAKVWAVMANAPQHTFQILTKRHARMASLLSSSNFRLLCDNAEAALIGDDNTPMPRYKRDRYRRQWWSSFADPLRNVWLGVSAENQQWADIRVPTLLKTPAAVRFLSLEPLLGPVDLWGPLVAGRGRPRLTYWLDGRPTLDEGHTTPTGLVMHGLVTGPRLDWVITGGESGPNARPAHPDWFRTIRDQCQHSNVAYHHKQNGEWGLEAPLDAAGSILAGPRGMGQTIATDGTLYAPGDLTYPDGPRYGEAIRARHDKDHMVQVYRVGRKAAGRELDGRTWDQYPNDRGDD